MDKLRTTAQPILVICFNFTLSVLVEMIHYESESCSYILNPIMMPTDTNSQCIVMSYANFYDYREEKVKTKMPFYLLLV